MAFVTDRDLLRIEPTLFSDASSAGIMLDEQSDVSISSGQLVSSSSAFEDLGVTTEHALAVDAQPLEIVDVISQTRLQVVRPEVDGMAGEVPDITAGTMRIVSFATLILEASAWMVEVFRLEVDDAAQLLSDSAVLNVEDLQHLVKLRAIATAFALAGAKDPTDSSLAERATHYEQRLNVAKNTTTVRFDVTGDNESDASQRAGVIEFKRR